ncbi:portal vertex protein [Xanthomonas phage Xoo-sp13]|nr:portal vertex protein [Xanthomonas phage Xoo-sp13]
MSMTPKVTSFYKIVTPNPQGVDTLDSHDTTGSGAYGNHAWYNRLVQGSSSRLHRYREYDVMDNDVHVAMALDIIAEEMCGNNGKNHEPLQLTVTPSGNNLVPANTVTTLKAALKTWCVLHNWRDRMFPICRNTVKYGDLFFFRPKKKNGKYIVVHPKSVIGAIVSEIDITDVKGWHIKSDSKTAVPQMASMGVAFNLSSNNHIGDNAVSVFDKDDVIRFTLSDDMSDEAPFGNSILRTSYKAFKQKELLEDALIIYRVQRAPERRVFTINTGRMPPHKVATHLEQIRNEIKQKKIPAKNSDGTSSIDSIYNPASMNEDFFFSENHEGKGSRVDVLPGGQNLGELQDLDYFFNKMWMGLRIPQSYINGSSDGGAIFNDGRVGIAYLQEIKFSLYIERLQANIEKVFDKEFKRFLHDNNIRIDPSLYHLELPQPSNFSKSKEQQMDTELLNTLISADGIGHFSKRFAMKKYGQLTEEEINTNERMLREERGIDPNKDSIRDLPILYFPEDAEAGGFDGGLAGGGGGGGFQGGGGDQAGLDELGDDSGLDGNNVDTDNPDAGDEGNAGASAKGGNQPNTPKPQQNNQNQPK